MVSGIEQKKVDFVINGMISRPVITVDGYAASGKSTLARELAKALGFVHLSTGLLYRAVGWLAIENGVGLEDELSLVRLISAHQLSLSVDGSGASVVVVDGKARGTELGAERVSIAASKVASFPGVRQALFSAQRDAFPGHGIVAEGRDMGTVVFPDAVAKFFVDARLDVRAARRHSQLGPDASQSLTAVRDELARRDERDTQREVAPTIAAEGALWIDNSDRPLAEIVAEMVRVARERIG